MGFIFSRADWTLLLISTPPRKESDENLANKRINLQGQRELERRQQQVRDANKILEDEKQMEAW